MIKTRLNRRFFNRSTLEVAQDLLGKVLVFKNNYGIITETEAYMGFDDPASHAAKGKTKRTELMFGPAGFSYVYLIYGMYHCLNIVTERKDYPAAVLIRGLEMIDSKNATPIHLNGPGKICKYLGINKNDHNGLDIINSQELYLGTARQHNKITANYVATPRIGIRVGQDRLWRFIIK